MPLLQAREQPDHNHYIAVCLNHQEGAVKDEDQQTFSIFMTMLYLVAFAGMENLAPAIERLLALLYEDPYFLSIIVYTFITGSVEASSFVVASSSSSFFAVLSSRLSLPGLCSQ